MDIDGKREMYAKFKSIISPGLVNLIILEFTFLLLAVYVGIRMWTSLPATADTPGVGIVVGVMLFLTLCRNKNNT